MARRLEPVAELYGRQETQAVQSATARLTAALRGRIIRNVNSTARGGGVAELLHSLVAYARGAGMDCRWAVIGGPPEFFVLTKRLHNAMHGSGQDTGTPFDDACHALYERVCAENAAELLAEGQPGDVVLLHDPQTLGLAPTLAACGARVIWRCHIGSDEANAHSHAAVRFLKK